MNDDTPNNRWPQSKVEQAERHAARVQRFAHARLPEWAPDVLVRRYADALESIVYARHAVRRHGVNPTMDKLDQQVHRGVDPETRLRHAEERAALLYRLAHYTGMHAAWHTITTRERVGPGSFADLAAYDDVAVSMLIEQIEFSLDHFDTLPKRTAKERKHDAGRVARLANELAQAIEEDVDGRALALDYLARRIVIQHFRDHEGGVESPALQWGLTNLNIWLAPPYDPFKSDSTVDKSKDAVPFARWDAHARLQWVLRSIGTTSLSALLRDFSADLQQVATAEPEIRRPNGGAPGTRFLIRRLSIFMRDYYDSPLDDTVARFVSASLNLSMPLGRDEVRDATAR
ncbi:hypothetical protein [Burkholderia pseudomallei]|uniref:hypothetical protein n=1 Tax=Burkholderia pseudomallei TaxID=28450 RepID=UPI001AD68858|nr:hypothetical protein [Burkholderia pseudomallei]MBO7806126.1 hypothetical protein [Burkholderia pseudomallei]